MDSPENSFKPQPDPIRNFVRGRAEISPDHVEGIASGDRNIVQQEVRNQLSVINTKLYVMERKGDLEGQDDLAEYSLRMIRKLYPSETGLLKDLTKEGSLEPYSHVLDEEFDESNRTLDEYLQEDE